MWNYVSVNFSVATILEFLMRDDCRTAGVLFGNLSDGYEPAVVRLLGRWVLWAMCLGLRSAQKHIIDTGTVLEMADSYFVYPSMGHAGATLP